MSEGWKCYLALIENWNLALLHKMYATAGAFLWLRHALLRKINIYLIISSTRWSLWSRSDLPVHYGFSEFKRWPMVLALRQRLSNVGSRATLPSSNIAILSAAMATEMLTLAPQNDSSQFSSCYPCFEVRHNIKEQQWSANLHVSNLPRPAII